MGALTPNLGLNVPQLNGDTGPLFATEINGDLNILDSVLGGATTVNVGGSVNVTATGGQAQNLIQNLTGVLGANITYFLPAVGRFYAIQNNTTGAFSLSVGCAGGLNVLVLPQGLSSWVWTDGQTIRFSQPPGWTEIATIGVSAVNPVTLPLPAPYRRFRITAQRFLVQAAPPNSGLNLRLSTDNGSTFLAGTNYTFVLTWASFGVTTIGVISSESASEVPLTTQIGSTANTFDLTIEIDAGIAGGGGSAIRTNGYGVTFPTAPVWSLVNVGAFCSTAGVVNAVQLFVNASTFTGTFIIEGLP